MFNHILFENSPRYEYKTGSRGFRLKAGRRPGEEAGAEEGGRAQEGRGEEGGDQEDREEGGAEEGRGREEVGVRLRDAQVRASSGPTVVTWHWRARRFRAFDGED